jgi:hypothetical protein
MPASAPNGFNYYNPPSTTPITVQTSQQLANAVAPGRNTTICATTQVRGDTHTYHTRARTPTHAAMCACACLSQ